MLGCEGKIEIRQKNQQPAMIRKLLTSYCGPARA